MMKKETLKKVALVALILLGIWVAQQIAGLLLFVTFVSIPAVELLETVPSPDGRYVAYIFTSEHFLVGETFHNLTVLPAWVPVPFERLLGIATGNTVEVALRTADDAFTAQWLPDGTLQVTLNAEAAEQMDIRQQDDSYRDVRIRYLYA